MSKHLDRDSMNWVYMYNPKRNYQVEFIIKEQFTHFNKEMFCLIKKKNMYIYFYEQHKYIIFSESTYAQYVSSSENVNAHISLFDPPVNTSQT